MIYIIGNRVSGRGKGAECIENVQKLLEDRGAEYETLVSEYSGHSIELAKHACAQENCGMIIAVGGDGTFSEILSGMDLSIPIAFVPAGTGNDFAKGAELPEDIETIVDDAIAGNVGSCDVLSVNGRRCLNIAGTGFDVNVLLMEKRIRKFLPGKISYMIALVITLLAVEFNRIKIRVDDGELRELSVFLIAAANGKYYGGGMPISPDARCDDGYMDLVIIKKLPRIVIPYMFVKFLRGKLKEVTRYVEVCRCKKVEFETVDPLPVNIDGELVDLRSASVEVMENAMSVAAKKINANIELTRQAK